MITQLILTGALLLLLVFLSIVESAYESLSEVSLRVMVAEREEAPRGRFLKELLERRQRFELMLILGTQLSIAAIAILTENMVTGLGLSAPTAITFGVVFLVIVIFRQLVPRMVAQNDPEQVFWGLLPLFRVFYRTLSFFVSPISSMLERMRKDEPEQPQAEEEEETMDEIHAFIDVGEEEGIIEEAEGELIQSIIEFSDTRVGEVMRPRPHIVAIDAAATVAEARHLIIDSKYSRIPVYRDQIDNIEGTVYVRDLLAYCEADKESLPVTECMRPAYFVPVSKSVAALLEEMQKAKVQIAMVIDEYGGVAGLVTIEDIIEEILGEIEDEDRDAQDEDIVKQKDGSYLVPGSTEIRKVELLYDREVEADDFTTVAGLIISALGRVPAVGERLEFKGIQFEVVEADGKRVNQVRLRPLEGGQPSQAAIE
jgi:putative hemolysin